MPRINREYSPEYKIEVVETKINIDEIGDSVVCVKNKVKRIVKIGFKTKL